MTTYDDAIDKAREIGREHGENAAAWWFDSVISYRPALLLDQVNGGGSWADGNGGPDTNPTLPEPDLSGEWADGYTPRQLWDDATGNWQSPNRPEYAEWETDLCDAYEQGFSEAVESAVREACERALLPSGRTVAELAQSIFRNLDV